MADFEGISVKSERDRLLAAFAETTRATQSEADRAATHLAEQQQLLEEELVNQSKQNDLLMLAYQRQQSTASSASGWGSDSEEDEQERARLRRQLCQDLFDAQQREFDAQQREFVPQEILDNNHVVHKNWKDCTDEFKVDALYDDYAKYFSVLSSSEHLLRDLNMMVLSFLSLDGFLVCEFPLRLKFSLTTKQKVSSLALRWTLPAKPDFYVQWGDGHSDHISSHGAPELTHVYAASFLSSNRAMSFVRILFIGEELTGLDLTQANVLKYPQGALQSFG
jgi:hypothetical protein